MSRQLSRRSGIKGKDKTWNRDTEPDTKPECGTIMRDGNAEPEYGTGMRDWETRNWQFNVNKESSNVNFR